MDGAKAAEKLRQIAEQVEKMKNLQGVAVIIPPDGNAPIEIVLSGSQQPNFAVYVINQIQAVAAPQMMIPNRM